MASAEDELDRLIAELGKLEDVIPGGELLWLERMEALEGEATTALHLAENTGQFEKGLELALLMAHYWWVQGRNSEGRSWLWTFLGASGGVRLQQAEQVRDWLYKLAGEDDPA